MITNFILGSCFLVLQFILSPIAEWSDATISPAITQAFYDAGSYINLISSLFPTTTLYIVLGIFLGTELVLFLTKGILFGIKRIPFVG